MANTKTDLHMHSFYSDDGQFSPAKLVELCAAQGIQVMAIADHNSIRANREGQEAAKTHGIHYIPAIEIDCTFRQVNLHVLGYGIDCQSEDFRLLEEDIDRQCRSASGKMLLKTQELGFAVTAAELEVLEADLERKGCWTGEMFAEVLLNKPEYADHPLLRPYREGETRGDNPYVNFYWDFYSQGKPCYVEISYPPLEDVVEMIHRNHGKAVLAHPGVNLKGREDLLRPIVATGLDGIEAFSSYHSVRDAERYEQEAERYGLFLTCGSDFHGKTKPSIQVGGTRCLMEEEVILNGLKKNGLL